MSIPGYRCNIVNNEVKPIIMPPINQHLICLRVVQIMNAYITYTSDSNGIEMKNNNISHCHNKNVDIKFSANDAFLVQPSSGTIKRESQII